MQFTRDPVLAVTVRHVEPGRIGIGERYFDRTVAVTVDEVLDDWISPGIDELDVANLQPLLDQQPDVVVVGTGWSPALPPRELTFAMARLGIGFEVMDTPAACRTFNILASEGRRPAAVLTID